MVKEKISERTLDFCKKTRKRNIRNEVKVKAKENAPKGALEKKSTIRPLRNPHKIDGKSSCFSGRNKISKKSAKKTKSKFAPQKCK